MWINMLVYKSLCILAIVSLVAAVYHPQYPEPQASQEEDSVKEPAKNVSVFEQNYDSVHEEEGDNEDKDKKLLNDAMSTVLDPNVKITKNKTEYFIQQLHNIAKENVTIDRFIEVMDNLSSEICKVSQESIWSYVNDPTDEMKKLDMIQIMAQEEEIKKTYWLELKKNYLDDNEMGDVDDKTLKRKLRVIKAKGISVQIADNNVQQEITDMQQIWSSTIVCAYNSTSCNTLETNRTVRDIMATSKLSSNSKELLYYWVEYHNEIGKKIRPVYKSYVEKLNEVAKKEQFADAGAMMRFGPDNIHYVTIVNKLWTEIKPLYKLVHDYVRNKLKYYYKEDLKDPKNNIPVHLLGDPWTEEWRFLYPKVVAHPKLEKPHLVENINTVELFDVVDEFHVSMGFESNKELYENVNEVTPGVECIPSSHDMCDGAQFKLKWCQENISNIDIELPKAAKLLTRIQYFKQYRNLPWIFREGPNLPFQDAITDMFALQLVSPHHLKTFPFLSVEVGPKVTLNNLLWIALEKFPLMGYSYVLDKWRWDVFSNSSYIQNMNQRWWDLRIKETGITPPSPRNESYLDPVSKYNVISNIRFSEFIISTVLEFQILQALCKRENHTGPLNECTLHGGKEAGDLLRKGMSLGASEDWRTILKAITGQQELSSEGLLKYFAPLQEFLKNQTALNQAPIKARVNNGPKIVGTAVVILTTILLIYWIISRFGLWSKCLAVIGLRKNGSLDIASRDVRKENKRHPEVIAEEKF